MLRLPLNDMIEVYPAVFVLLVAPYSDHVHYDYHILSSLDFGMNPYSNNLLSRRLWLLPTSTKDSYFSPGSGEPIICLAEELLWCPARPSSCAPTARYNYLFHVHTHYILLLMSNIQYPNVIVSMPMSNKPCN